MKNSNAIIELIQIKCPNCSHHFNVYHLDWSQIACPKCKIEMSKEHYAKDGRDQDGGCPWCGRDCPDAGKPQGCWYQGCPDFPHGE